MTVDEYWKKYNHCPKCRFYTIQGSCCDNCRWAYPYGVKDCTMDKFEPTDECIREMNEVDDERMDV